MLSKAKLKHIKSLQIKKFRKENRQFLVEGAKSVLELIHSDFTIDSLLVTQEFLLKYRENIDVFRGELLEVSVVELSGISNYESNNAALAVVQMKENIPLFIENDEIIIALDSIKDPGNLGTIMRIADWYGIQKVVCSDECAELYNPKVIASSMGSFTRISVFYTDLKQYLPKIKDPIWGASLDGKALSTVDFSSRGVLLMGSESSGIHNDLFPYITQQITIPGKGKAESLNVAVATGIICDRIFNK